MKIVGAAFSIHSNNAARIPPMIGSQYAGLNAKLSNTVRSRNCTIHSIKFRVLHKVTVHQNGGAVHLPA